MLFENILKTAFRKLSRHKAYSLMNITGLTLGLAGAILIFLLIRFETSFDGFHSRGSRLFKIITEESHNGNVEKTQGTPGPLAETLSSGYESIEKTTMVYYQGGALFTVKRDPSDAKFQEKSGVAFTSPSFFEMFDFPWIQGDPSSLNRPDALVLSKSLAKKFFGNREAIGQVVRYDNQKDLIVTGIVEDFPKNTDFQFTAMVSSELLRELSGWIYNWNNLSSNVLTYVLLKPGASPKDIESQTVGFHDKYRGDSMYRHLYHLEPVSETHFNVEAGNVLGRAVDRTTLTALGLIGLFIVLTASINFINMATAQAAGRSREIGVRKVLGAGRSQIALGFFGETFLLLLCAAVLAVGIVELAGPAIMHILDIQLHPSVWNVETIVFVSGLVVSVTFLAGFYPARVLSGFRPVLALKGKASTGGIALRRGLVVVQFAISQMLIVGTLVVVRQMDFVRNQNAGLKKDGVVVVPVPNSDASTLDALKVGLLSHSGVEKVSFSNSSAISENRWDATISYISNGQEEHYVSDLKFGDDQYIEAYGLELLAGRCYLKADTIAEFVVNESMIRQLGIASPVDAIGQRIRLGSRRPYMPIVGVVKDFQSTSMHEAIRPALLSSRTSAYQEAGIRIRGGDIGTSLRAIEAEWNQAFPKYVFEYQFLDERVEALYRQEQRVAFLFQVFAGMAILIGSIGLLGLVSYLVAQKTKEIGVRKVLGATVADILGLFSKEFAVLVGIAFVLAAPVAYLAMNAWLENFAYKISLGVGVFAIALAASVSIVIVTVGYKAFRAATANPVDALQYE